MADPALDRLLADVAGLRTYVQALTQGLSLMQEAQATHTEMLRELLQLAAADPAHSPLADVMAQILVVLTGNQAALERLGGQLAGLPEHIGSQVARAVEKALATAGRAGPA